MRKILFVCNTYYQLIAAMQLNASLFIRDQVSVVLSDHSRNAEMVADRLRVLNFFEAVYYVQTKEYDGGKHSVFSALKEAAAAALGLSGFAGNIGRYDELVYFNPTCSVFSIFSKIDKEIHKYKTGNGKQVLQEIKCSRLEEGMLSYSSDFLEGDSFILSARAKLAIRIRKLLGKKNFDDVTEDFYCFYPEAYKGSLKAVAIPLIDINGIVPEMLVKAFDIDQRRLSYPQKYIFFSSVYDFEGGEPIGEARLIGRVAELVGREHLLVKQHPRDRRSIFKDMGLRVDENSVIPWEAIQLSIDFSDKIFLTAASGSVLSANLMTESGANTYFLYDSCDSDGNQLCDLRGNLAAQRTVKALTGLLDVMKGARALKKVKIAKSIEEIL